MGGLGQCPLPWQRELLEVAYEVDAFGLLWYREIVIVIMRQSGKSTIIIPVALHRMIAWGERQFGVYIAQTRDKAREKLIEEHFYHIDRSPFRKLLVPNRSGKIRPVLVNGSEHLKFVNGSKWAIDAPTEEAGHGGTLGLAVGDEIFALPDNRLEAGLMPTMATVADAMTWWISTPGKSKAKSPFMWQKVEKGRSRVELARIDPSSLDRSRSLYVEFSIPEDVDIYDPRVWWGHMPAVGYTQTIATIQGFADSMDEREFRRAFGCQWGDDFGGDWKIPADKWAAVQDRDSVAGSAAVWVVDVSPDRAHASISLASVRDDGKIHLEMIETHPGTDWVIDGDHTRELSGIANLVRKYGGKVYYDHLTVGALAPDMHAAGVEAEPISAADIKVSAAALLDAVLNGTVRHLGQPELTLALASAATRVFGDGWAWARGRSMADITALVSVTLAHWMLLKTLPDLNFDPLAALREGRDTP
ncbi:MAG: phage terminase family protein [Actinobacteria bacterium]|nr:phage terminase family protein [Actinomycetota bacterium]